MMLMKILKNSVIKTHEHISNGFDADTSHDYKQKIEKYSKELSNNYE